LFRDRYRQKLAEFIRDHLEDGTEQASF
jgi:hypothetical protein